MDFSNISTEDLQAQLADLMSQAEALQESGDLDTLADVLDQIDAINAELASRSEEVEVEASRAELAKRFDAAKSRFAVHSSKPKARKTPVSRPGKTISDLEAENEKQGFNYAKAVFEMSDSKGRLTGWEAEYHQEARRLNPNAQGNLLVPRKVAKYDLNTTTGANSIPTEFREGQVDLLRAASLVDKMGFTIHSGLKQKTSFVVQDGDPTLNWYNESDSSSPSNPSYRVVTLDPKNAVATVALTRKYLNSVPNASKYVLDQLVKKAGNGIDVAWINGAGTKEPLGLLNVTALTASKTAFAGAVTWPKIVEMETSVVNANGATGVGKYLSNGKVYGACKTVAKSTTAGAGFIYENGLVNGCEFVVSSLVPSTLGASPFNKSAAIYSGDWSQAYVGFFNDDYVDLLVDEYTGSGTGLIKLNVYIDMDFQVVQPGAFNISVDIAA